jgi:hypothetical protein
MRPFGGVVLACTLALGAAACGKHVDVSGCSGATPVNTDGTTAARHFLFPVNSGSHAGLGCDTCHGGAPDWATVNCICCHVHSQTATDTSHNTDAGVVAGYQYVSQKCFECHTTG